MVRFVAQGGNTLVPPLLAVESLGYKVEAEGDGVRARRGEESYLADDPVALLGLIRLVEMRSWESGASDADIDATLRRFGWHEAP